MILQRTFIAILLAISPVLSFSQTSKTVKPTSTSPTAIYEKIYRRALELNDLEQATTAVYSILAISPEKENWKDTLCLIYHGRGLFLQSYLLSNEILEKKVDNFTLREVRAQALEGLGKFPEALFDYDFLMSKSPLLIYRYKSAALQYMLKRYGESEANIQKILADEASSKDKVGMQTDGSNGSQNQEVPIRAAAYNVRAAIALDMNKSAEALEAINQALEIAPDFYMARQNLERIQKVSSPK